MSRLFYITNILLRVFYDFFKILKLSKTIKDQFHTGNQKLNFFVSKRKKMIVKSALKTNFYKSYFSGLNFKFSSISIKDFPIIEKKHIRDLKNDFTVKNILLPKTTGNTGGSTGTPLSFYTDLNCRVNEFSHQLFLYKEMGFKPFDKIYSFGGVDISKNLISRNIFWKKKIFGFPFGKIIFSAALINRNNIHHYYNKISIDKPQFLRGYPSAIVALAEYVKYNKIKVEFIKAVLLTSEMISESNISLIREYLKCDVVPQYGQCENTVFGFAKPNSLKYYCSPYYGLTEIIDIKSGEHVKENELGEIVVTSLSNIKQPFIRYRTGDLAVYGGTKNGFVILKKLYGRNKDFIFDINSKKVLLVGLIFGSHTEAFNLINDWQFTQDKIGELLINIHPSESWDPQKHEKLIYGLFKNHKINLIILYNKRFIKTSFGKRSFLIQNAEIE